MSLTRHLPTLVVAVVALAFAGATSAQSSAEELLDEARACRNARPVDFGCIERALSRLRAMREIEAQRRRLERELTEPPEAGSANRIGVDETAADVSTAHPELRANPAGSGRAPSLERCRFRRTADDPPDVCPPRDLTLLGGTSGADDDAAD